MKSKSVKKVSDEDRSSKRKLKSVKRKRHYSSSSDSEDIHKKKKKTARKSKSVKRKRHSSSSSDSEDTHNNNKKKNPRKKSRHISTSPSDSTNSCSSFEKKRNSKKKTKLRKHSLSSGLKLKGRERSRSLKRSRSSSTSSSSRSRSRSRSYKGKSFKKQKREKLERESIPKDKIIQSYDDFASSSKYDEKREKIESVPFSSKFGSDNEERDKEREEREPTTGTREKGKLEKTQNEGTQNPAIDLELVLRHKALENFIKLHKSKKSRNNDDERENLGSNEPTKVEIGNAEKIEPVLNDPPEEINEKDLNEKEQIVSDLYVKRPRLRSVIIPTHMINTEDNPIIDAGDQNEGPNSNLEESNSVSANPYPNPNSETNPHPNPNGEGEFEKKTFSRMRDGEMVEVSYKVYIPNKTPALARRKFTR